MLAGLAAREVAGSRGTISYRATTQIREQQIEQDKNGRYPAITSATSAAPPDADHFLVPAVAEDAAKSFTSVDAGDLLAKLSARPIDVSEAELSYRGRSPGDASAALTAYAKAYIDYRRAQQRALIAAQLAAARQIAEIDTGAQPVVDTLQGALAGTAARVPDAPGVVVARVQPTISPTLAMVSGLLAGLALGMLVALAANHFDPRVRNVSELKLVDMDVFEATPEGLAALRVNLELTAVGDHGGTVTVSPTDRTAALSSTTELARSFSDAGVSTLILDLDSEDDLPGVRDYLDGNDGTLNLTELGPALHVVTAGHSSVDDIALFSAGRVRALLVETRKLAQIVIVNTPAFDHHPASALFVGAADGAVLVVHPGTTWGRLEDDVDLARRVAGTQVRLWFERKPHARSPRSRPAAQLSEAPSVEGRPGSPIQ